MPIVGVRPETGLRIELERPRDGGPPWVYEGRAVTPDAEAAARATVQADGAVHVELAGEALAERVRLLMRAACKRAGADAPPPPRRIVRWRPDA